MRAKRSCRIYMISMEHILDVLAGHARIVNIPPDTTVERADYDFMLDAFMVCVSNPTFPSIPEGEPLPRYRGEIELLTTPPEPADC